MAQRKMERFQERGQMRRGCGAEVVSKRCPQGKEYVFRRPDGSEVGRAATVAEFVELLKKAPLDSIVYHAKGKHFGPWLRMMGLENIASKVDSVTGDGEELRRALISLFQ